ncbi:MAG TPA: tetratricopeptide repeat protein, partial [Spirochaetota bacterium]|nr:tetratricopeptide repeat protein [Spirochaetota bacterium]
MSPVSRFKITPRSFLPQQSMIAAVVVPAVILVLILFCVPGHTKGRFDYGDGEALLEYFIHIARRAEPVEEPKSWIYSKNEILYCDGDTPPAIANNRAADKMAAADYEGAITDYESYLKRAPLFLPFRYNIGVCYFHVNDRARARLNLEKALNIVPEYYLTDIQLGHLASLEGSDDEAILHYRDAIRKNPKHLDAMVLVGNIYFKRHQREMASKYYEAVLAIKPRFANALLGRAKVMFEKEEYYKAYQTLGMIDMSGEYDRTLHYYFAECAYKLQDYKNAYEHYTKLLEFRSDRFFI